MIKYRTQQLQMWVIFIDRHDSFKKTPDGSQRSAYIKPGSLNTPKPRVCLNNSGNASERIETLINKTAVAGAFSPLSFFLSSFLSFSLQCQRVLFCRPMRQ